MKEAKVRREKGNLYLNIYENDEEQSYLHTEDDEIVLIRDACNEYLENETGSIEVSGYCYPRGAKNMVVGDGFLDMQKKSDGSITTEGGLHIAQPKEKPKKLWSKYVCRKCKDPCKLKVYGGDFIPFGCPFGHGGANWERKELK